MKALINKIHRLARRHDRTPQGVDKTFVDEQGMKAAIERAEAAMAERDWARATALWRQVLCRFGDHAPRQTHLRLSKALRRDGQVIAAQAVLFEGLKRDPTSHRYRRELAKLATSEADWERGASGWQDALSSASTPTPELFNGLAEALCQLGRFREAGEVLQHALVAGIEPRDIQSVFDSEVLRTRFLGRFAEIAGGSKEQAFEEDRLEWYRVAIGARRLPDASGLDSAVTGPSAISVSGWPNAGLGNNVRQLANALEVAERLEVPRLYIPPAWYLQGDDPIHLHRHEVIQAGAPSPEERLVLRGVFFLLRTFDTDKWKPYRHLAELRPLTRFRDREPMGDNDLVIHIRSGDIFRKDRPPAKNYGQPPLAYYLTVLRQRRWQSVHVVYENDHNPVIEPLLDHLRAEGIEHTTVVTDLTSTVEFLLRAKTMVAGPGTFIPIIAGLSSNLDLLYTFEGRPEGVVGHWGAPGIAQVDVIDDPGDYRRAVISGSWENRPDQVKLMLHYPETALRVVPGPTAGPRW